MSIRLAISAPMPWLTVLAGRFFGRKKGGRRLRHYLFPRSLRFTKFGRNYVIALIILGTAAINTGNNLLYLVSASLMSLIVISGILSESTLKKLSCTRPAHPRVYKNTGVAVSTSIKNGKSYLPSYSFTLEPIKSPSMETHAAYVLKLEAGKETKAYPEYIFKKRGYAELEGMEFKTSFPFGLFTKGRTILSEERVLVYPEIRPVSHTELSSATVAGKSTPKKMLDGSELYGLRPYTPYDDARHIHWKASARSMKLLTKDYQEEKEKRALVLFDNFSSKEEDFEEAVTRAASLVSHYLKNGYEVSLKTLDAATPFGHGQRHYDEIMTILALIMPADKNGRLLARAVAP